MAVAKSIKPFSETTVGFLGPGSYRLFRGHSSAPSDRLYVVWWRRSVCYEWILGCSSLPTRKPRLCGSIRPLFQGSPYSDKGKFHSDLNAARTVNMSEYALNKGGLQLTLNHRVPGSSPGAPTIAIAEVSCIFTLDRMGRFVGRFVKFVRHPYTALSFFIANSASSSRPPR